MTDSNSSGDSTNDELAFMPKNFKQMMKKKGKFQHSSIIKDARFKKKYKEETMRSFVSNVRNLDI